MYTIGLTSWSEHVSLIKNIHPSLTLSEYSAFFPTVEIDTFFYGIPSVEVVSNWLNQVPKNFKFVVKANSVLTLHNNQESSSKKIKETLQKFKTAINPLLETNSLKTILLQFPPFFEATKQNIAYLIYLRNEFTGLPLSIEFRNASWFADSTFNSLVLFCQTKQITLITVDEPQLGKKSVPFKTIVTNPKLLLVRLHGRNKAGWLHKGADWRKFRTLYNYSNDELLDLQAKLVPIENNTKEICIIFNNNSGGHAANNALSLKKLLNIEFDNLNKRPPQQLDFF